MYGRFKFGIAVLLLVMGISGIFPAPDGSGEGAPAQSGSSEKDSKDRAARQTGEPSAPGPKLSVTQHTFRLPGGGSFDYTATAGHLRLRDESEKPKADMFFVAYTIDGREKDSRPLTFLFNGGPGASSVWLHMGVAGPVRVITEAKKPQAGPPSSAEHNPYSWLPWTDLVFIDPVGTGFSRAIPPGDARQFYSVRDDVRSVGDFIRLYTSTFGRWRSPRYLAGESYGAMRAAGLLRHLYESFGMEIDGLVLISPALDLSTIQPGSVNDLPFVLFLPSYAAAAWYHEKIAPDLRALPLSRVLAEAEKWAIEEYMPALARGDLLPGPEKDRIAEQFATLTGLSQNLVRNSNLRVARPDFTAELLRPEGLSLGFMDARTTLSGRGGSFLNDPGMAATLGPYTGAINQYLADELKVSPGIPYISFSEEINSQWKWGAANSGFDALDSIRKALNRNRRLRILAAGGYFDLNVPYFAVTYTMSRLGVAPELRGNITVRFFHGGHMFYTSGEAIEAFTREAAKFFYQASVIGDQEADVGSQLSGNGNQVSAMSQ